jgi:hypothetical protein
MRNAPPTATAPIRAWWAIPQSGLAVYAECPPTGNCAAGATWRPEITTMTTTTKKKGNKDFNGHRPPEGIYNKNTKKGRISKMNKVELQGKL